MRPSEVNDRIWPAPDWQLSDTSPVKADTASAGDLAVNNPKRTEAATLASEDDNL